MATSVLTNVTGVTGGVTGVTGGLFFVSCDGLLHADITAVAANVIKR
jgi:hypothetical protein